MNKELMHTVLETLVFLELSGDDIINPDAAVQQMEQISSNLSKLNSNEKVEFISFINDYAERERNFGSPEERIKFIEHLPKSIGLKD